MIEIRKTPLVLTGIFVDLLKNHFKTNSGDFQWHENAVTTKLIIKPAYLWDAEIVQKRPACYIKRGGLRYQKIVINNLQQISQKTDTISYVVTCQGSIIIVCMSENAGTVERLAEEVSELFIAYTPIIRKEYDFIEFKMENIGEVSLLKEHSNIFIVPVTISFLFSENWSLVHKALKVDELLLKTNVL